MRCFKLFTAVTALGTVACWVSVSGHAHFLESQPAASNDRPAAALGAAAAQDDETPGEPADEPLKALLSGRVMLLSEALKQRGIKSYEPEIKGQVVLVTPEQELVPIVPDWRGRAFYQDERLRDRAVELIVNRRRGVPWVQVLSIYMFDDSGVRNITDYWCDVCSIPMYEIKDCECCQAPIRLRLRPQELPKELQNSTRSSKAGSKGPGKADSDGPGKANSGKIGSKGSP
ncbi:MAG: hypothetical protein EXS05_11620 [Planctomycetaceae bacterium]|nr:hypothetical protein [Planctomycetaceae bacterium]